MTPIRILAGAALALAIAGGAQAAQPYNPNGQRGRVDNACVNVLGTEPGEAHYDACVEALSGAAPRAGASSAAYRQDGDAGPRRSYFQGSPRDLHRREGQACASVGLDPAYQAYDSCVADLSSSLFAIDHPLN